MLCPVTRRTGTCADFHRWLAVPGGWHRAREGGIGLPGVPGAPGGLIQNRTAIAAGPAIDTTAASTVARRSWGGTHPSSKPLTGSHPSALLAAFPPIALVGAHAGVYGAPPCGRQRRCCVRRATCAPRAAAHELGAAAGGASRERAVCVGGPGRQDLPHRILPGNPDLPQQLSSATQVGVVICKRCARRIPGNDRPRPVKLRHAARCGRSVHVRDASQCECPSRPGGGPARRTLGISVWVLDDARLWHLGGAERIRAALAGA